MKTTRILLRVIGVVQITTYMMVHALPTSQLSNITCTANINSCSPDKHRCSAVLALEDGETPPRCHCDKYCSELNDCCWDYTSSCPSSKQANTSKKPYAEQATNWKCFQYSKSPRSPGIWMVASCPANFIDHNNTKHRCEAVADKPVTSQMDDLLSNVPVVYKRVTFRNIYCARCNHAVMLPLSTIFWDVKWRCNVRPPDYLNEEKKTRFLLENCPEYGIKPEGKRRYCYPVVTNCSVTGNVKTADDCVKGPVSLVHDVKHDKHYKNPSCLICNGGKLNNATCGPSEFSRPVFEPKSFEMVLQFQTFPWKQGSVKVSTESRITCGKHLVYDKYLEECRVGVIPDPLQSVVDTYRIKAWLKRIDEDSLFVQQEVLMDAIARTLDLPTHTLTLVRREIDDKAIAITFDVKTIPSNQSDNRVSLSIWGLKRLIDFKDPFNISIDGQKWKVFKITHRRLTCSRPNIYPPSNYTYNETHVIINNRTILRLDAQEVHFITQNHSLYGIQAGSLFVCTSVYSTACGHGQVLLALKPRDYILQNGSLLFIAANITYDSTQFEFQGNNAWICSNYTNVTPTEHAVPWISKFGNNLVLWYFTVCGLSLSIVSLFTLLVTYFIFKELRTMPGKNLMSLTTSLLLSHFIWLLGSGDTHNPLFCRIIAVVLHYLFLVSFACTTVIAYDTRRAFPKNSADMSNILFPAASKKRFIAYLLFSWGVPLVFVVTCVIIDQQGQVTIGYGNAVICWLTDMIAQIVFFGVPVGVMLLYNLVAFVITVQAIRAAKLGSKHLHRQGANRSNEIKIYFRLMTIMGFTWFFGFGAHAIHKFLMYPFVVLTSLHGVYLAFAFAFKPYVYNLYRNRFANLSRRSTASTIDLTTSMNRTPSKDTESVL